MRHLMIDFSKCKKHKKDLESYRECPKTLK
jgi:hypothetical protein